MRKKRADGPIRFDIAYEAATKSLALLNDAIRSKA